MKKATLVTTPMDQTWPEAGQNVLFLGDWCLKYSKRETLTDFDFEVLPYHWNDREKLYRDYGYIQSVSEKILLNLSDTLNDLHGENRSLRYWRILIGPWLGYFLSLLFDHISVVETVVSNGRFNRTVMLEIPDSVLVPKDMSTFIELATQDLWNHCIFSDLLLDLWDHPSDSSIERVPICSKTFGTCEETSRPQFGRKFRELLRTAPAFLYKQDDAMFFGTHSSILQRWQLFRKLKQYPRDLGRSYAVVEKPNWASREWELAPTGNTVFERISAKWIAKYLPIAYLEGYRGLKEYSLDRRWPRNPKMICVGNGQYTDEVVKMWIANKVEDGTPLVIAQHGGNYGTSLWCFQERHEKLICDHYWTWGWRGDEKDKTVPMGRINRVKRGSTRNKKKDGILLVTCALPRYSYYMYSVPVAGQWLKYLEDQFRFVEALSPILRGQVTVRLYKVDWGWEQERRWMGRFGQIDLDYGGSDIQSQIDCSRVFVSTYNSTTYLDTFSINFPTIIFWNPVYWELRDSTEEYFLKLEEVGVFHRNPESAARHLTTNWDRIERWWFSSRVQTVIDEFKSQYSATSDEIDDHIVEEIKVYGASSNKNHDKYFQ